MAARNQTFSKHIPEPAPAAGAGRTAASGGKARAAVLAAGAVNGFTAVLQDFYLVFPSLIH